MNSGNGFVNILFGIVIIALLGYFIFFYYQRQQKKDIDALKEKHTDLLKVPIEDTLYTLKNMKLTGQTHRAYESMQANWQTITRFSLPEIEALLVKANEANEHYNIVRATKNIDDANKLIDETKRNIEKLYKSLQSLLDSEAQNRKKLEVVSSAFQELKKAVLSQSVLLKSAAPAMEKRLEYLDQDFNRFKEVSNAGDHMEAKEILSEVEKETVELNKHHESIPKLYDQLENQLKEQLIDLKNGYKEMLNNGFIFHKIDIQSELSQLDASIRKAEDSLVKLNIPETEQLLNRLGRDIDQLYDAMESEVESKTFVLNNQSILRNQLSVVERNNQYLETELDRMHQNYVLNDKLDEEIQTMNKKIEKHQRLLLHYDEEIKDKTVAYSLVRSNYEVLSEELVELLNRQEEMLAELEELSKREKQLKNHLDRYEIDMRSMKRYIEKHHLPGLPNQYLELFFKTTDQIEKLADEIERVQIDLNELEKMDQLIAERLNRLDELTEALVDNAHLTEATIQYANRYRLENDAIDRAIRDSLLIFDREYRFDASLETIQTALEKIEPGSSKKIKESYLTEKDQRLL
ncbi:septation ring formation regulator EzrA [Atopobacter phocae]|uniref:septation ring formation regulator EzrA n=1 Tax=Atopobacter phocae TaxID=136492 RepID=UPI00047120CC|nr:septation ring formation regulator EzrA [Atopobacter phocae]